MSHLFRIYLDSTTIHVPDMEIVYFNQNDFGGEVEIATQPVQQPQPDLLLHPISQSLPANDNLRLNITRDPSLAHEAMQCLLAAKAPGTVSAYTAHIRKFELFCLSQDYIFPLFPSDALTHYILHLSKNQVTFSAVAALKPAISYLEQTLGRPTSFTPDVDLLLDGLKRRTAAGRPLVRKAVQLPSTDLQSVLQKFIHPFLTDISHVNPVFFRTAFRMVIEYHTLCRLDCFRKLRARHFTIRAQVRAGDV